MKWQQGLTWQQIFAFILYDPRPRWEDDAKEQFCGLLGLKSIGDDIFVRIRAQAIAHKFIELTYKLTPGGYSTAWAHLELGESDDASRLLLEAAGQAPNDAYVQAQVALGHSLAGNVDAARSWAAKALAPNPTDIVAIQVSALHDPRSDEEVLSTHEAVVGKRAELYAVLAHRAVGRHERLKAREWFDQAVAPTERPRGRRGRARIQLRLCRLDSVCSS